MVSASGLPATRSPAASGLPAPPAATGPPRRGQGAGLAAHCRVRIPHLRHGGPQPESADVQVAISATEGLSGGSALALRSGNRLRSLVLHQQAAIMVAAVAKPTKLHFEIA
ncbi:hypothetical protein NDU88_005573 [Pleurodeles waltl]|uniref:Uncharacterized protein n=1 Tax=Pleurodeles waltl TaxID=8319 RepID=A0AAV7TD27_PLEWA|nr:hypothetical protein NDU88_005573 [Pleurodeles waltl]